MDKPVVMYMEYPRKKPNRLPDYDYSQNGAYFITICTKDRKHLLSRIAVGTSIARPPAVQLTRIGKLAETATQIERANYVIYLHFSPLQPIID